MILFSSVFRICIRILAQDKVDVSLKSYIIMLIKVDDDLTPLLIKQSSSMSRKIKFGWMDMGIHAHTPVATCSVWFANKLSQAYAGPYL